MSSKFEFISCVHTPDQKYKAIVKIKAYDKVFLLYKLIPTRDGASFFPAPASYKIDDTYISCFSLDSTSDNEEIKELIKSSYKEPAANPAQQAQQAEQTDDFPF